MGLLDGAEGAQVFPIRVDDISIYSKAAFQCGILVDVSHQISHHIIIPISSIICMYIHVR